MSGPADIPASRKDTEAPAASVSASGPAVPLRTWIAVIGATLGSFMAVLNIQIVNASLADIQGAIGAGSDEGGWITTSYLVAEIIVIPLSVWLSQMFSVRNYLLGSALLFLAFSVACAFAHNLEQMIALRALQGFAGGVLIPLAFTIIITTLPKAKQPAGLAMFALSATFAPAIGPTIGGYLTENFGWEYIFYVNLLPGALMVAMLWYGLEKAPMKLGLFWEGDWLGIITMAVGLGALQTFLEEGNKNDWLGSPYIVRLGLVSAVALTLFLVVELRVKKPLLNLKLLLNRNFAIGNGVLFMMGVALYGSVFILPLYLARIQGYNAEQIGFVLAWTGLPQLLIIPFIPRLMKLIDVRILMAVGFALFAASNFMNIHMTADYSGDQLMLPNIVRAIGQALCFAPLTGVASAEIAPVDAGSASALLNVMRNLGGAIGIAVLQTFVTKREQFHSNIITQNVTPENPALQPRLDSLTQYFLSHGVSDPAEARAQAFAAIAKVVREQAYVQAFSDTFFLLGVVLVIALIASLFFKSVGKVSAGEAH
jgi:MFS transporter, DHA2 family, multidrug resistance protein